MRALCGASGTRVQAHGPDGGSEPSACVRKRSHLPHQLHLSKQRQRDVPVRRRPAHQPVAPGDHRPQLQYPAQGKGQARAEGARTRACLSKLK